MSGQQTVDRRLSRSTARFCASELPVAYDVGFSAIFGAPEGRQLPSGEALCERAAGRLDEVPWCRWRLDGAPLGLSEPRWVDDAEFDLRAHIVG